MKLRIQMWSRNVSVYGGSARPSGSRVLGDLGEAKSRIGDPTEVQNKKLDYNINMECV